MSDGIRSSYGRVAEDYAGHFRDEMGKKPFDRKMLEWLAEKVNGLEVEYQSRRAHIFARKP